MGKKRSSKSMNNTTYLNPGLQEILQNIYPKTTGMYVVSKSLYDNYSIAGGEFFELMKDYIGEIPSSVEVANSYNYSEKALNIQSAMNFLKNVIINEQSKENSFINWLRDTTGTSPPTTESNWTNFIKEFNNLLKQGQSSIISFQNELARLESNINAKTIKIQTEKGKKEHTEREIKSVMEYTADALEKVASYLSGDNNETGREITEIVLKNYGSLLVKLSIKNGKTDIELDQGVAKSLILTVSQILIKDYYNNKINNFIKNSKTSKFSTAIVGEISKYYETIQDTSNETNQQILKLIQNLKDLPFLTNNLMKNFKIENQTIKIPTDNSLINTVQNITNEDLINKLLERSQSDFSPTIKLVKNQNALAEINVSIEALAAGALGAFNIGNTGAKSDNIIGWLVIEQPESLTKKQTDSINNIKQKIHNYIQELTTNLKKDNTLEYYNEQEKNWNKAIQEINNLLTELNNTYQILAECFIIEESTKSYTSLNTPEAIKRGTAIGGEDGLSFKGGSLGSNIAEQVRKISALQNHQLISESQADWLITAAINCGPGLILENMKTSLENYFSMFAVLLLFDDQRNIANEVSNQLTNDLPSSKSSVHVIHTFTLNNGTYPLSYVLSLTYEVLTKLYGLIDSEISPTNANSRAKVSIKGFINPDSKYEPNSYNHLTEKELTAWEEISQEAIRAVHMEVHFLSNFLAVLNSLGISN